MTWNRLKPSKDVIWITFKLDQMNATEQWPTHLELFGHTAHGVGRAVSSIWLISRKSTEQMTGQKLMFVHTKILIPEQLTLTFHRSCRADAKVREHTKAWTNDPGPNMPTSRPTARSLEQSAILPLRLNGVCYGKANQLGWRLSKLYRWTL